MIGYVIYGLVAFALINGWRKTEVSPGETHYQWTPEVLVNNIKQMVAFFTTKKEASAKIMPVEVESDKKAA